MSLKNWFFEIYDDLVKKGFYGKLTMQFEAGRITIIRKEESIKPPNINTLSKQSERRN